jgi:NAD(P)-dependent dehydrogenase (short-subunit alcohol dehydrogenase family)
MTSTDKRVALITGASKGIGYACADRLLHAGYDVSICARGEQDLATAAARLERLGNVLAVKGDMADPDIGQKLVSAVMERFGRIDVLVNNAGIYEPVPFIDFTAESWDRLMAINVRGPVVLSAAVVRCMRQQAAGGRIVHMSSTNGIAAEPGFAHYNASKAALTSLAMTMALELASDRILVNAVAPGWVRTPLAEDYIGSLSEKQLGDISPLRRAASPAEIAAAVLFLCGPDASYVTGTTLVVDGGMTAMLAQPRDTD